MPETSSTMLELGTTLPSFSLPDFNGRTVSDADFKGAKGLVVAFICNHCPFVRHIRQEFARFTKEYEAKGLKVVAIASNDVIEFPEDGPEGMKQEAEEVGYNFPYLFDETQATAQAYGAVCTPDFFGYNANQQLQYRGRLDETTPSKSTPESKRELFEAMKLIARTGEGPDAQIASMGCSIKWRQ